MGKLRVIPWITILVIIVVLIVGYNMGMLRVSFNTTYKSQDNQIIESITKKEQVVLLALGIQGLHEVSADDSELQITFFDFEIPGTSRRLLIQYSFTAKLGIDGGDIKIEQTGDNEFTISIPKFIFIGYADQAFETAVDSGGVLRWVTPRIDTAQAITKLLSDAQDGYIAQYDDILKEQAEVFYTRIINGIDPSIKLVFVFEEQ